MVSAMRKVYFWWFVLISAAIVLQFYLAGYGLFAFNGLRPFDPHLLVGDLIGLAIMVGIAFAFAARVPWRITGINGGLFVLMFIQAVLAHAPVQGLAALHVVNGVLIFGGTLYLTRELYKLPAAVKAPVATPAPAMMR